MNMRPKIICGKRSSSLWVSALVHCGGDRVVAPQAVLVFLVGDHS